MFSIIYAFVAIKYDKDLLSFFPLLVLIELIAYLSILSKILGLEY